MVLIATIPYSPSVIGAALVQQINQEMNKQEIRINPIPSDPS